MGVATTLSWDNHNAPILLNNHEHVYNTQQRFSSTTAATPKSKKEPPFHSSGLFSIPGLQKPSDFVRLAAEAMETCNQVRADLTAKISQPLADQKYQAQECLYQLDHISKTVCNVIDASELCRSVHASEEWRTSADRAFAMLSSYIGELNADTTLYQTMIKVTSASSSEIQPPLTEEDERFCLLMQAEFERDGIHLPDPQRHEVQELQMHVTQLETMFSQNMVRSKKEFTVDREALEGVFAPQFLEHSGIADVPTVNIPTDSDIANALSKYSSNPSVRKQVHMESMTACPENVQVLEALIHLRHEVSTKLGFESYADRFLRDKMAQRQDRVYSFLQKVLESNKHAYKKEMEELSNAKRKVEHVLDGTLEPWDISFYTGILKARNGFDTSGISVYLTLDNCIEGIKILVDRLFGIQVVEREMALDEAWDIPHDDASTDSRSKKTSLRRLDFLDPNGESLGTLYLDLEKRDGKYGHAAHFTVRCGCMQEFNPDAATPEFQKPIIALVCNLSNCTNGGDSILTHSEVETIYHEMGHLCHSMLSRTKYQHLSGTRASMDFVETPSHWMENYVWDPEFLQVLGRHHDTGAVIPPDLVDRLRQSRYQYHAIERQNQCLYAVFDQKIHGVPILPAGAAPNARVNTTEIFATLQREHGVPYAEGTHWHSRFGHLVTYGAGYYGYLYSQVFAGDIWRECFEGNSMSRDAGDRIWKKMLIHGGAHDPHLMLEDLLGRRPRFGM